MPAFAQLEIQPVIPITLNEDWNVISRTILPITYQDDVFPGTVTNDRLGASRWGVGSCWPLVVVVVALSERTNRVCTI